jgi:hypothetical protein
MFAGPADTCMSVGRHNLSAETLGTHNLSGQQAATTAITTPMTGLLAQLSVARVQYRRSREIADAFADGRPAPARSLGDEQW